VTLFNANFRKLGWKVELPGLFCATQRAAPSPPSKLPIHMEESQPPI